MKKVLITLLILAGAGYAAYAFFFKKDPFLSVLVFSKTEGFRHESIGAGKTALLALGKKHGFPVDTTEDSSVFTEENLKKYNVVIFLNTTGDVLNEAQQLEFNRFIQAGGGFVGIHAAADTEYEWPWYGKLVGAYFNGHPNNPNVREADVVVVDGSHISTQHLPERWHRNDEWYNYKEINPDIVRLLNLDEKSYEGGTNGDDHPIAWYHDFDGGRSFYTGGGHTDESFEEPEFLEHLWGGIRYAMGPGQKVDYNQATVAPEENRFEKTVLEDNLNEPMELDLLPDGKIIYVQRGGAVRMYDPELKATETIAEIKVHNGHEDGLLGLAIDPAYADNNWVYFFYSPPGDAAIQRISRFELKGKELDMASEKILLEAPTQREQCCHSAGSLEFGPDGHLFISLGDNTNPHASDGYSPSDEQEGRGPWDAQKSSANANDLRGKILRIKPEADGTYSIPEGNLFPRDGSAGRPEIYVMGNRNPFRIAVDQHTGYLYWGEVGPDAGTDSLQRGPMGYDEVNQARGPGFFGWPYFIADNKPYHRYDFAKKTSGEAFDPNQPVNSSPNNTGPQALPAAQPAFIYYPYGASKEFPLVGKGGRNAMAGPVFHLEDYPDNPGRYPKYYDGKLFIYDWMRGWIMAVTLEENGDYKKMERFLPSLTFNNPIDMLFGPNGDIYLLEYGTVWFSQNPDARLVHLTFNSGNRQPLAVVTVDQSVGAAPLTVQFDAAGSKDFDGDELTYEWYFENGEKAAETGATVSHTFAEAGEYQVHLVVSDPEGKRDEKIVNISAGNEPPEVAWDLQGNRSFYWGQEQIDYSVRVKDQEDGTLGSGITEDQVAVSIDFLERGSDVNEIELGHQAMQEASRFLLGKSMMEKSDCKTCHQPEQKSIGPAYQAIAAKYKGDPQAVTVLAGRIIQGGGGVWGETAMAAHPQLSQSEAEQMTKYILSLAGGENLGPKIPLSGSFTFDQHKPNNREGTYIFTVSYTDQGGDQIGPLTAREVLKIRSPHIEAHDYSELSKAMKMTIEPGQVPGVEEELRIVIGNPDSWVSYGAYDLTGVEAITLNAMQAPSYFGGGKIELYLDSIEGELLGSADLVQGLTTMGETKVNIPIKAITGKHQVVVRFVAAEDKPVCAINWLYFSNEPVGVGEM